MPTDTVTACLDAPPGAARSMPEGGGADYTFGQFVLYPARKLLVRGAEPVALGGRAFDLLVALVARAGEVVGHHELVAAVWPHAVVEENGLRVHMSALRKALGEQPADQYILTVLGRGYRFVKPVCACHGATAAPVLPGWSPLPAPPSFGQRARRLIGRETVSPAIARALAQAPVATLAGAGGIGKTAVALAYAAEHRGDYADGCHLIDFAALDDPALVPAAIASALGISLQQVDPVAGICNALRDLHTLLVFDNCEHVLPAAALFAGRITAFGARVAVLATSREPLGIAPETVLRLPPLALPALDATPDCRQALALSAVALFVERAQANCSGFALTPANLPCVIKLCQQLDGLPLAIELAAARVESLGVEGLAARLDDMFRLLTRSRRLAGPRHAALEAMLDCSHRLLGDIERAVLRRLSVFHAAFSLESALLVCAFDALAADDVRQAVLALAAKSLLTVDAGLGVTRYRCLNTTRRYARARLAASGEANGVARRHAAQLLALCGQASAELDAGPAPGWQQRYGGLCADLLAALDWALGPDGESALGLALCAAVPMPAIELGMVDQFRRRVETALAIIERGDVDCGGAGCATVEARLLGLWTLATTHVALPPARRVAMFGRLLRLAGHALGPQERALTYSALCLAAFSAADYARIEQVTAQAAALAGPAPRELAGQVMRLLAERWSALGLHFQGRHGQARMHAQRTLAAVLPPGVAHVLGPIPQPVAIGVVLARSDWLEGACDSALVRAHQVVTVAGREHPFALALALGLALAPVALWRGDAALARDTLARLEAHARRHALSFWCEWALQLRAALDSAPAASLATQPLMIELLVTVQPDALPAGVIDAAGHGQETWCGPELQRVRAERAWAGGAAPDEVDAGLARAFVMAQAQGALSWELRCALSLCRLWSATGRARQGRALLAGVLARLTQGHDTADQRAARALLE